MANHIVDDYGRDQIAVGAPCSVARSKVKWPKLISYIRSLHMSALGYNINNDDEIISAFKIQVFEKDRSGWDRADKETWRIWCEELAGIKASYNGLAAEYNAQMAKINWAFCNVGTLPMGADTALPEEYWPYLE
jgi:hypothetical protein